MIDRLSLSTIRRDYWRSLRKVQTQAPDMAARSVLVAVPIVTAAIIVITRYRLASPTSVIPAVSLLAGVLLAAAGQVISLRARVADSVMLSGDARLRAHMRETISGILLAAVSSLFDAVTMGSLALFDQARHPWLAVGLTAVAGALGAFVILMFLATARRLYATYLEAFESGAPLPKQSRHTSGTALIQQAAEPTATRAGRRHA